MIRSFRHKGLEQLYRTGVARGIRPEHKLSGDRKGYWSIAVSGNWRVIFRFSGTDVELVDYLDYH